MRCQSIFFHPLYENVATCNATDVKEKTNKSFGTAGGGFELVSCPHYLGEIVIYVGLTLLLDFKRPLSWLPLVWVVRIIVYVGFRV